MGNQGHDYFRDYLKAVYIRHSGWTREVRTLISHLFSVVTLLCNQLLLLIFLRHFHCFGLPFYFFQSKRERGKDTTSPKLPPGRWGARLEPGSQVAKQALSQLSCLVPNGSSASTLRGC